MNNEPIYSFDDEFAFDETTLAEPTQCAAQQIAEAHATVPAVRMQCDAQASGMVWGKDSIMYLFEDGSCVTIAEDTYKATWSAA